VLPTYEEIARMIDHSILRPELGEYETREGCELAARYAVASVCVKPCLVPVAVQALAGSTVKAGSVVGFPHGAHATATKVFEADDLCKRGAAEIDMVSNIAASRANQWDFVKSDIAAVLEVVHGHGALLKVIFENCYLEDHHKIRLCEICSALGVDFIKTSTGFGSGGATEEDIILMRKHAPAWMNVKAAGGVRTLDAVIRMRDLGCARIGATATAAILDELRRRQAAEKE
jgi:deoxyribose-phosphate aldolase